MTKRGACARVVAGALAVALVAGCTHAARVEPGAAASVADASGHGGEHFGFAWYAGTVDEAFAAARAQGKPLFLDWGAVWCPPCRALRAEVFATPRFAELMRAFVPVYLDGDAPEAQLWADKLGVSSYPTMLVVDAAGTERLRMLGAADLGEVDAALSSVIASGGSFRALVDRALAQPASLGADDWALLSLVTWEDPALAAPGGADKSTETLRTLARLAESAPATSPEVAARLAGSLLELAASDVTAREAQREAVRAACPRWLDKVFHDERSIVAARRTILDAAADVAAFCAPDVRSQAFADLAARFAQAVRAIAARPDCTAENRLAAMSAVTTLWRRGHPDAAVPSEYRVRARALVAAAFSPPPADAIRHTVVAAASDALHDVGDDDAARALLLRELPSSRVPWYLQGELAAQAAARGDVAGALRWSGDAVRSAEGNATRIQWRVVDLQLLLRLRPEIANDDTDGELVPRLRALYDLAGTLPDGWAGRNRRRLRMVARALAPALGRPSVRALLADERARCAVLDAAQKDACIGYFDPLLANPAP